jgi:nitric oxide reductase NorE protein
MFMVSKSIEYFEKFAAGITPATNDFYMWYFTLTGIHLLHVVFGTSLLIYLWINARRGAFSSSNRVVPECVASY